LLFLRKDAGTIIAGFIAMRSRRSCRLEISESGQSTVSRQDTLGSHYVKADGSLLVGRIRGCECYVMPDHGLRRTLPDLIAGPRVELRRPYFRRRPHKRGGMPNVSMSFSGNACLCGTLNQVTRKQGTTTVKRTRQSAEPGWSAPRWSAEPDE
jgi:hypothetical protein